jgi:hypothetical protein
MSLRFDLTITLGNAAMLSGDDVAAALRNVADTMANRYDGLTLPETYTAAPILDLNGARVGSWAVVDDEPAAEGATVYRVGDPDPTPDVPEQTPDNPDGSWCGATPDAEGFPEYMACTWELGHSTDLPHVSGNGRKIIAVWEA